MVDYAIDNDFQAKRTNWGSFINVRGLEEFEQALVVEIHNQMQTLIGKSSAENTQREKIKLTISRLAKQFNVIDEVRNIRIERTDKTSGTYQVEVTYFTEEDFTEIF